ncbi:Methionine synthase reductase [Trichinella spiralis]|uniref:Methionine synthase reductase n=1 Tax=Trichinella spiralis TaxID=6334 RepID=A0ABR3KSD8_TRISP
MVDHAEDIRSLRRLPYNCTESLNSSNAWFTQCPGKRNWIFIIMRQKILSNFVYILVESLRAPYLVVEYFDFTSERSSLDLWSEDSAVVSATAFPGLSTSQLMMADYVLSCRALCVDAFALKSDHLNDSLCFYQSDCLSCWKYCETFYKKYLIMDSICEDSKICFIGCQMACYFYHHDLRANGNQEISGKFDAALKLCNLKEMNKLEIQWQSPVPHLPTPPVLNIVYALFWKKAHQRTWVPLQHTINNSIIINNLDGLSFYVDFLLLAYTRDGAIAVLHFTKGNFRKIHELKNEAAAASYYCIIQQEMTFFDPFTEALSTLESFGRQVRHHVGIQISLPIGPEQSKKRFLHSIRLLLINRIKC